MDKCTICRQEIKPNCDWQQGRCPHREPLIKIQPKDTSKGHFYVSLVKSSLRIGVGITLVQGLFVIAGALLIVAEVLGIIEELV